jgi:uncharacterized protein YndB with AHSA1/START domain
MSDADLFISRDIHAPRETVWEAWSDPEKLRQWWIPEPLECCVVELDLRAGGGFETEMREADQEFKPHMKACFLDVLEKQRIVFTTSLTAGWRPVEPWLAMTAIISLTERDGITTYSANVLHRSDEDGRKHVELGYYDGWGTVLEQLARQVETQARS